MRALFLSVLLTIALPTLLFAVEVSGKVESADAEYGDANFTLVGDTIFDWKTRRVDGDLDIGSHNFSVETGGGNPVTYAGVISGTGTFKFNGGGNADWQYTPSFLAGAKPNPFSGTLIIERGTLALAKPNGIAAMHCQSLVLGGGSNQAILRLDADHQLGSRADVTVTGKHPGRIWTQGHSQSFGTLTLQSEMSLDLGDGACQVTFADSHDCEWDLKQTITVRHWTAGKDSLRFGDSAEALTAAQLKCIGFENPIATAGDAGDDKSELTFEAGLYTATLSATGELVPGKRVVAIDPPFDVSNAAKMARRKLYETGGIEKLTGEATPLTKNLRISFFGDSITWQNNYLRILQEAIRKNDATKDLEIQLINRGINGGGVLQVRDGSEKAAYISPTETDGKQASFADVIAADKADVAVVFIGVNDAWWRDTSAEDFEQALRDIVTAARKNKTLPILATLAVYQEKPDGTNPKDKECDQFADLTRKVAKEMDVTLIDLRRCLLAYLMNENAELHADGTLTFEATNVLTYDGVHPNSKGNQLIADLMADGIYRALNKGSE